MAFRQFRQCARGAFRMRDRARGEDPKWRHVKVIVVGVLGPGKWAELTADERDELVDVHRRQGDAQTIRLASALAAKHSPEPQATRYHRLSTYYESREERRERGLQEGGL